MSNGSQVLTSELRSKLEKVVVEARDVAEAGARVALESLAVHHYEPYSHMDDEHRRLRNRLRARGRQLGDVQDGARLEIRHLIGEVAYEHWHRMLFAQFLAENNLLIEPEMGIAVSIEECEELAREAGEDPRAMAARFAQQSLPEIFRVGDPVLELALSPETQQALDRLLDSLTSEVFTSDDSLGWTYQFWQSKRKDEVNASGNKIGADALPAVTQLFTEHYMVQFLYHNTIGAWHAGKVLAANPELARTAQSEQELRDAVRLRSQGGYDFEYLRFVREPREGDEEGNPSGPWRPAAGTFDGWPKAAKEITVLDPCCGSGHFLNEGFGLLVRLRMDEEGLRREQAIRAVLANNLHGLEIDPRCTQIAAFNVALAAWKLIGKPIELPSLHIACSGLSVGATKGEWISLAGDDPRLRAGMERLYNLFEKAPVLGSLIDPKALAGDLLIADSSELQPLLENALEHEREDAEKAERAVAAQGMAKAAELLSEKYTLAITNVPYLRRARHGATLRGFCEDRHPLGKPELATVFLERILGSVSPAGTGAIVIQQYFLFLKSYEPLRIDLLRSKTWSMVAKLGSRAFETVTGEVVNVALVSVSAKPPPAEAEVSFLDADEEPVLSKKQDILRLTAPSMRPQRTMLTNPGAVITPHGISGDHLLSEYADCYQGTSTGDNPRWVRKHWEFPFLGRDWVGFREGPDGHGLYAGATNIVSSTLYSSRPEGSAIRGEAAWDTRGMIVAQMGGLPSSVYSGERFNNASPVIIPKVASDLPAIWEFSLSGEFADRIRLLNPKMSVDNGYVGKVPFDLARWQKIAAENYPAGLPEPQSDDPTQWLFHGHPAKAERATALQVAVGRLLGYRWPPELDLKMRLADEAREWVTRCDELLECTDEDGIVCIPSIRSESPAAERLRTLLAAAFGDAWTAEKERSLIEETGSKATDLDTWLRNDFFEQHCKLFHHRPFIWHIWDGRARDGFHALVNYHKLAEGSGCGRRTLENVTYSYLGDWITRQDDGVRRGMAGAEDRLAAAQQLRDRLVAILEGEPPFDLFIRWKSLAEQPIGWDPDIDDGVRLNARPFLASDIPRGKKGAGVFRWKPNIKWGKDRGKEPLSLRPKDDFPWFWAWDEQTTDFLGGDEFDGNRWNDLHYTNEAKGTARERAGTGGEG